MKALADAGSANCSSTRELRFSMTACRLRRAASAAARSSSRRAVAVAVAAARADAIPPGSERFAFQAPMIVLVGSRWSAAASRASVVRSTAARPAACVSPVS